MDGIVAINGAALAWAPPCTRRSWMHVPCAWASLLRANRFT